MSTEEFLNNLPEVSEQKEERRVGNARWQCCCQVPDWRQLILSHAYRRPSKYREAEPVIYTKICKIGYKPNINVRGERM